MKIDKIRINSIDNKDKDFLRGYSVNGSTITQKKVLYVIFLC